MHLIKTALDLKNTGSKEPILLLGTWCLDEPENIKSPKSRYNLLPYHWDDRNKFESDFIYLTNIYESILKFMIPKLNEIHSLQKDEKYWRIIIGPWLRYFIDAVFDRFENMRLAVELHPNLQCSLDADYDKSTLISHDFVDFWERFIGDEWNEAMFSECAKYLGINHTWINNKSRVDVNSMSRHVYKKRIKSYVKKKVNVLSELVGSTKW